MPPNHSNGRPIAAVDFRMRFFPSLLLSFAKVMEHYAFYYIPLTLPSPPTTGERIKVRGPNVMAIFVPLFT
jgi:hypothetical protein